MPGPESNPQSGDDHSQEDGQESTSAAADEPAFCAQPTDAPSKLIMTEMLKSIYEYYSLEGQTLTRPRLTSTRFQRMALDAALLDGNLTSAKVDIVFHRTCKGTAHMSQAHFMDAVVRLAAIKFPEMERLKAVFKLYKEHLSSFSGGSLSSGPVADLPEDAIAVVVAARHSLRVLYEGYFPEEVQKQESLAARRREKLQGSVCHNAAGTGVKIRAADRILDAQAAFCEMCGNFELTPPADSEGVKKRVAAPVQRSETRQSLMPKSTAAAVYREVSKTRNIPQYISEPILGDSEPLGVQFTYVHFAVALLLLAQKCFGTTTAEGILRLFHWMDSSTGRFLFSSRSAGLHHNGSGIGVRLVPDEASLPKDLQAMLGMIRSCGTSRPSSSYASSAVDGSKADARTNASSSAAQSRRSSSASGPGLAQGRSTAEKEFQRDLRKLPAAARKSMLQTFGYYAAAGDPLNRNHLSSQKFHRFLRDTGLVATEQGKAKEVFAPPRRWSVGSITSAASTSRSALNASSSASTDTTVDSRRSSFQVSLSVSPAKKGTASGQEDAMNPCIGLPLRVFARPPLTVVQADLIFVQAIRSNGAAETAGANKGKKVGASRMTLDGFMRALTDIAKRTESPQTSRVEALEALCEKVLDPLTEAVIGDSDDSDVAAAAAALAAEDETANLLQQSEDAITRVFNHYVHGEAGAQAHWAPECMAKFAQDFELNVDFCPMVLQRIFRDSVHHGHLSGTRVSVGATEDRMTVAGFRLALIMCALKDAVLLKTSGHIKVVRFFKRLNHQFATSNHLRCAIRGDRGAPIVGQLFPLGEHAAVAAEAASGGGQAGPEQQAPGCTLLERPRQGRHREEEQLWKDLMQ
eukprot:TRINITY_DN43503_c0_g3_i1.p1 TRINITY_DN43503_c0_g3~~TRINITY_DN43503_c0_g3_i1.p1  ORF type:complete len:862 (-),score=173.96 TRINITY_DN43503_c0_g3_i1:141-2726(-)